MLYEEEIKLSLLRQQLAVEEMKLIMIKNDLARAQLERETIATERERFELERARQVSALRCEGENRLETRTIREVQRDSGDHIIPFQPKGGYKRNLWGCIAAVVSQYFQRTR